MTSQVSNMESFIEETINLNQKYYNITDHKQQYRFKVITFEPMNNLITTFRKVCNIKRQFNELSAIITEKIELLTKDVLGRASDREICRRVIYDYMIELEKHRENYHTGLNNFIHELENYIRLKETGKDITSSTFAIDLNEVEHNLFSLFL
jgi:hypothetical protein